MKKIILTFLICLVLLAIASFVLSFEKKGTGNTVNQENPSAKLPSSGNALFAASLDSNFIPLRNWAIPEPDIEAKAAGIFDPNGNKFLYQKDIEEKLPIASLTKIMTAVITLENIGLDNIIVVSKNAVMTEGENGRLIIGESLTVRDLLYIMLIESSNDAATALSGEINNFISLMNKKAKEIGMANTNFEDAAGISAKNYSTISDLVKLVTYSFTRQSLIWQILSVKETEIASQNGKTKHHLINTDKLLDDTVLNVIAGKTGFTEEAGGCMIILNKTPNNGSDYLITTVLGSKNRELESKELINWTNEAYAW